jgi:hypothetical protein
VFRGVGGERKSDCGAVLSSCIGSDDIVIDVVWIVYRWEVCDYRNLYCGDEVVKVQ